MTSLSAADDVTDDVSKLFFNPPLYPTAVTRGFQTTTQDLSVFPFLPQHHHTTRVLLLLFITPVWTHVFAAYLGYVIHVYDDDDDVLYLFIFIIRVYKSSKSGCHFNCVVFIVF